MKRLPFFFSIMVLTSATFAQSIDVDKIKTQTNSELFRTEIIDNEKTLILEGNQYDSSIDPFTGMEKSNSRDAKVFLIGEKQTDYIMN